MQHLFLAGFFAASGSAFGKLSGGEFEFLNTYPALQNIIQPYIIILQALCVGLMIVCNVLNWRHFLRALHSTEQTLTATVISSASNYICSFLFGIFLFGESISMLSLLGTILIISGMGFLYI
ncbi:uncharacterized protein LOC129940251 [Eupeodes corollae]|uniref:uncharacterized protein LOC129940251 n=1 Tax=Eupeodes corollae TaxID=290404 RepID=UPI002493CD16|nr:uncharacterized protein LOC129940251 [Eupeodes corollae]